MVSEIGRTGEMEKLLLPGVTNRTSSVPGTPSGTRRTCIRNIYKLSLTGENNVFKTIGN